jgi:hypothetical protein
MKAMTMEQMLETLTLEIVKDFTDRNGNMSDEEIKALRAVGAKLEQMAEIAGSIKDLNEMKKLINE